MNNTYIAFFITLTVCLIFFEVLPCIYNKLLSNKNIDKVFDLSNNILKAIEIITSNIDNSNEKNQTLKLITKYAIQAVQYAEQLYKSNQLDKDSRKEVATNYIIDILNLSNIEVTDQIKNIISATIEAAVLLLPKTN